MTAPAKSSRWGSLLQQAVAGVEARLDNILAEGDVPPKLGKPSLSQAGSQTAIPSSSKPNTALSRPPSTSGIRTNDRLQERLAKAIAAKSSALPETNLRLPHTDEIAGQDSAKASIKPPDWDYSTVSPEYENSNSAFGDGVTRSSVEIAPVPDTRDSQPPPQTDDDATLSPLLSVDTPADFDPDDRMRVVPGHAVTSPPPKNVDTHACSRCAGLEDAIEVLRSTLSETQSRHQEESHSYVEQMDALQSKLRFLSREVTGLARKDALLAPVGSVERKLAEKDEKLSLLLEEGQSLAATEQKHRAMIKKLREKIANDERMTLELKSARDKAEAEVVAMRSRAGHVDDLERLRAEIQKTGNHLNSEIESLRSQVLSGESQVASLKADLQREASRADAIEARANKDISELEKRHQKELEDTRAALQLDKMLVVDRARIQASELNDKAERAAERNRATELEMKGELQVMEAKLEAMRALAEEASSTAVGDSQSKLLRQVETLQTQYATASDNWQGIEASLVSRITSLEKERDDALRRESDMRKRAREAAARFKRQEHDFQEMKTSFPSFQHEAETKQNLLDSTRKRAEAAEAALLQAQSDLERQNLAWKAWKGESAEKDRRNWLDELPAALSRGHSRPESPQFPLPLRTLSSDFLTLQPSGGQARKISTPSSLADGLGDLSSPARRLSSQLPPRSPASYHNPGLSPVTMAPPFESHSDSQPAPSPLGAERDDIFDGLETSSSPHHVMQDVMSVSTVAAGPTVQLVERMSAAIRRLEGEKMAAREELARISSQRDEARAEIAGLMREVEIGTAAQEKVAQLEGDVADINARYQTTLEMLGEKSELVEELRADVQDVKAMYRDLIERTVK